MWVFDDELDQMVQRDITFVPGLYKIFDEILGRCPYDPMILVVDPMILVVAITLPVNQWKLST